MNLAKNLGFQIGKAVVASMSISLVLLLVTAYLMNQFEWSLQVVQIIVYGIYFVSGIVGGVFSGKLLQNKRILWGLVTGTFYCLILMCGLIGKGSVQESTLLFLWCCTLIGSILGGILS